MGLTQSGYRELQSKNDSGNDRVKVIRECQSERDTESEKAKVMKGMTE